MTTVIHIRDKKPDDIYIGRAGKGEGGYFGNPFTLKRGEPRGSTIDKYRAYFLVRMGADQEFHRRVLELKDKRLVCFCAPPGKSLTKDDKPFMCHGQVLAQYLDGNL